MKGAEPRVEHVTGPGHGGPGRLLVPHVYFTARRDIMGALVNRRITTVAASAIAAVIIALNIFLLAQTAGL